jgi:hypothetical protein
VNDRFHGASALEIGQLFGNREKLLAGPGVSTTMHLNWLLVLNILLVLGAGLAAVVVMAACALGMVVWWAGDERHTDS